MPELHGSGDIFRADARAGFDEGIVRGRVGSDARLTFQGDFSLCHGLDAQLSARAAAALDAQLTTLWLISGRAHGEAFAAAGAGVEARIGVDLFDSFGFSTSAAAFAEASVAGRLSVGLDLADAAALAQASLNNVAYDVFVAFLNEVTILAGVWGELSAAAMAEAHISIQGSLKEDSDAGFLVDAGGAIGLGAGGGYDFYAGMKFESPKRFYLYAVERITRNVAEVARSAAPPELKSAIPLLELALPTILNVAYEIAQKSVIESLGTSEVMASAFVETFAAQMQRFLLDKLAECGGELLRGWLQGALDGAVETVVTHPLDDVQRTAVDAALTSAMADIQSGALDWETFERALPKILEALAALFPDSTEDWRKPVTVLWTALTAVDAVRTGVGAEFAEASAGLAGLSEPAAHGIELPLPDPPGIVREELNAFFEGAAGHFTVEDAISYLIGTGISDAGPFVLPELQTGLDLLSTHTGITVPDLIDGVLRGVLSRDVAHTELYRKLRAFFEEALDGFLLDDLLPALRRAVGPSTDARIWLDEVAEPTLQMASSFVFDRLDGFVNGTIAGSELSPAFLSLRTALSHLVGKIVTRNVVVAADILLTHAIQSLEQGFLTLESSIRRDPRSVVGLAAAQVATALLPPLAPVPPNIVEAARELFATLSGAAAAGFGPAVFTQMCREKMRGLMIRLIHSVDGQVDYSDGDAVKDFFTGLLECAYVPDPDGLIALMDLQISILKDEADILMPRVTTALELFYLRLTRDVVDEMFHDAEELVRQIAGLVQAAWRELQRWRDELQRRVEEAQAAARALAHRLETATDILKHADRRREIIAALRVEGIAAATDGARSAPGFDLLPADGQNLAIGVAVTAFTLVFDTASPLIDLALEALGQVAGDLARLVDGATDLPDLLNKLATKIQDKVVAAVNRATGLRLPGEITPDDVGRAAADVIRALESLRMALDAALDARIARDEANHRKFQAQDKRNRAQADFDVRQARQADLVGEPVRIEFAAPLAPTGDSPPVYGPVVQMILFVEGARPSYVQPGATRRVLVAVNGQPLPVAPGAWHYETRFKTLSLSTVLTAARDGLRPGLNVIECSVTDGVNEVARSSTPFAVNMALPAPGDLRIDPEHSLLNTPGDDHAHTAAESVALNNFSQIPVALRGWSVRDAIGHRYIFGEVTISSGGRLTLHTGPGVNVTSGPHIHLFQGKRRAIWNNTGDTALLVDPTGIVRASFTYRPGMGLL